MRGLRTTGSTTPWWRGSNWELRGRLAGARRYGGRGLGEDGLLALAATGVGGRGEDGLLALAATGLGLRGSGERQQAEIRRRDPLG